MQEGGREEQSVAAQINKARAAAKGRQRQSARQQKNCDGRDKPGRRAEYAKPFAD